MEKSNHGGKRAGAGRKRQYVRKVTFNANKETLAILEKQERQAEYINQAIAEKWQKG